MNSLARLLALSLLATPAPAAHAAHGGRQELRYVQKSEERPSPDKRELSRFQEALGKALARQMGRPVRFISLPRKRMLAALEGGEGDILCGYVPAWVKGDVYWSRPFIPTSEVLVSSNRVSAPRTLEELKGKRIGTVLGFRYPEVEQRLGADFVRDDAPSSDLTLLKWQAGRYDYFLAARNMIDSQAAKGALPAGYHLLVINEYQSMCAVAKQGNAGIDEVNTAIDAIEKNGELARLLRLR
ncbi:MAG: transporter substrate-binding domain-containing protein [Pseudomonadota bacterium]